MALSSAQRKIADDLLAHNLDLLRLNASMRLDALKLLKALEKELTDRIKLGTLTEYSKASADYLLASAKAVTEKYYADIAAMSEEALAGMSSVQANVVRAALADVGYGAALAPATHFATALTDVLIQGAPSATWWEKQAADVAFKFANTVRQGIVQGKTNGDIIREVRTVMDVGRANAAALVQTSVQQVANSSLIETFKQNADVIKGMMQLSTLDSHTTDICMAYSGAEWDLDEEPIGDTKLPFDGGPPRHWNCRSVLVPITKSFAELGMDAPEMTASERASMDGPIAANTTFDSFLERKGTAFQDEMLGKGRAELWRNGTITLPQLLDLKGRPLTLAELKSKYQ
jgi:SPP1 gp7 family putative phage head morphogenesis protein